MTASLPLWTWLVVPALSLLIAVLGVAAVWGRLRKSDEVQDEKLKTLTKALNGKVDIKYCGPAMDRGESDFAEIKQDLKGIRKTAQEQATALGKIQGAITIMAPAFKDWAKNNGE